MWSTLESASPKTKEGHVSIALADHYNKFLGEIRTAYPEIASALPNEIKKGGFGHSLGLADAHNIDLSVYVKQILDLLDLVGK